MLGITRTAGQALGRADLGWLGTGSVGDLVLMYPPAGEPPTVASLIQHMGIRNAALVVRDGAIVVEDR